MKRICARPWCRHETIEDGRECAEHTNETLRETRTSFEPAWRRWTREHNNAKAVA